MRARRERNDFFVFARPSPHLPVPADAEPDLLDRPMRHRATCFPDRGSRCTARTLFARSRARCPRSNRQALTSGDRQASSIHSRSNATIRIPRSEANDQYRAVRSMLRDSRAACRRSVQTFVEVRRTPWFDMSFVDLFAIPRDQAGPSPVFRAFAALRLRPSKFGWPL